MYKTDEAGELYKTIKKRLSASDSFYSEMAHCKMVIEQVSTTGRISAFCVAARIGETTFYKMVRENKVFRECYHVAQMIAQEKWEMEPEDNKDNPDWDAKEWNQRGSRYYAKKKDTIMLNIDSSANPWEQYQQILKQAECGDFTASEIKQVMESINVGTRVFEAFKLQSEVDKMKSDLTEMSHRNGHNTSPTIEVEERNQAPVSDTVCKPSY